VPNLGDSIRHMMEGSLSNSLKHIISNAVALHCSRELLSSLHTVFSALCLNTNGLSAFIESKPFDKLLSGGSSGW